MAVLKVNKNQRFIIDMDRQINFMTGSRWEFMLRLLEGPVTKRETHDFLQKRGRLGLPETFIHNFRSRVEQDPKNPTLLIKTGRGKTTEFRLDRSIEYIEDEQEAQSNIIAFPRRIKAPDHTTRGKSATHPNSQPIISDYIFPMGKDEDKPTPVDRLRLAPPIAAPLEKIAQANRETLNLFLTKTLLSRFVDDKNREITLTQNPNELIENIHSSISRQYDPDNLKKIIINSFIVVIEKYWNQPEKPAIFSNIEAEIVNQCSRLKKVTTKARLVRQVCMHFNILIPPEYETFDENTDNRPTVILHPERIDDNHRSRKPSHNKIKI